MQAQQVECDQVRRELDTRVGRDRTTVVHSLLETLERERPASHTMSSQLTTVSSGSRRTASSISGNARARALPLRLRRAARPSAYRPASAR
ncbi:hypothetical protein ACFWWC_47175 [Streptomyces sp. NPDC058642]|uniref:hypothetical protein n=1 Tax=Streptomyces sp. NPDC058642 TaxID=3346572 RepID=UPI00365B909F